MENKLKKRMLIVVASVLVALVLLAVAVNVLERVVKDLDKKEETTAPYQNEIKFSDEYITDIAELYLDEKYAALDQSIHYYDPQTGVRIALEEEDYDDYNAAVELLCNFVYVIRSGDAERYNTFFSDRYFLNYDPQDDFSVQKLYDIEISPYSETKENTDGITYTEYIYALEYKIRRNNGSLRADMGSDSIRTQYILITDRDGQPLIDRILAP